MTNISLQPSLKMNEAGLKSCQKTPNLSIFSDRVVCIRVGLGTALAHFSKANTFQKYKFYKLLFIKIKNTLMKIQIINFFVLAFFMATFSSCNPKKYVEDKINETIAEEVTGAMLGTDVETSNLSNADKATAKIDVTMNGKKIGFENAKPVFHIANDSKDKVVVAINFMQEKDGQQHNLQLGFTGKKSMMKAPMTINFEDTNSDEKVAPIFTIMTMDDTGMKMSIVKKGTLKVVEFSDEKVLLEIDAEGGENNVDTHDGKNLVPVKGTIICKNPMMTYMGVKKDEIF